MTRHEIETINKLLDADQHQKAYTQAFGEWGWRLDDLIPQYMQRGLIEYILRGTFPGSFLTNLLQGDLFTAMGYADSENCHRFHSYCMFLHNYAPSECFKSKEIVTAWAKSGGYLGQQQAAEKEAEHDY